MKINALWLVVVGVEESMAPFWTNNHTCMVKLGPYGHLWLVYGHPWSSMA